MLWQRPQVCGLRATDKSVLCAVWQAAQLPSEPSGLTRPAPLWGRFPEERDRCCGLFFDLDGRAVTPQTAQSAKTWIESFTDFCA